MDKKITNNFQKNDERLYSLVKKVGPIEKLKPARPDTYFSRLVKEIIYQQLSGKVANVIFSRFKNLFPRKNITPSQVLKIPHHKMRQVGLSNAKAKYVKNLARAVIKNKLQFKKFKEMSDKQVAEQLIQVKGIGPWTAEMFLIFVLAREDVFSYGDLGLKNAIKKLYNFKKEPSKEKTEKIVSKWKPYSSYACLLLWASIDAD